MNSKAPRLDRLEQNVLINGNMDFWQRGTSFPAVSNEDYTADRWVYRKVGAMVHTVQRSTDIPPNQQGAQYSLEMVLTTPDDTISGSDFTAIEQRIEGYELLPLIGGDITFQFWVKAGIAGDYIARVQRFGGAVVEDVIYTINAVDTWELKTISVNLPNDGGYNIDNQAGLRITLFQALGGSAMVNGVATGAGSFKTTRLQVLRGNFSGITDLPFRRAGVSLGHEELLCKRYYWRPRAREWGGAGFWVSVGVVRTTINYPIIMRAIPTATGLTLNDLIVSRRGTSNASCATLTFQYVGIGSTELNYATTTGTSNAGDGCTTFNNSDNAIEFDAEL